jgi:hypothetical protein
MNKLYRVARAWIDHGTVPIPLMYRSKAPKIQWQKYQHERPTNTQLLSWFSGSLVNIAVITGWYGLTVLDFDTWDTFETWVQMFGMPDTYMVLTARGVHAYYALEEPAKSMSLGTIDIKGQWGYVLVPPSIHPTGARYQTLFKPKHIKRAERITDIVPEIMLPSQGEVEIDSVSASQSVPQDPWAAAANPRVFTSEGKVADVLARHRIEDLFPDREPTSTDKRFWLARCPFHPDKNPSFWIDVKEQKGGCFAGCIDKSVDVINVYAEMHGLSNQEALNVLASC